MEKKQYTQEDLDRVLDELHKGVIGKRTQHQWDSSVRLKEPRSEEFKKSISKLHTGKKVRKEVTESLKKINRKPIIATNLLTGESIQFDSTNNAAKSLSLWPVYINYVLKGKHQQAKGYTFRYA